MSTLSTLRKIQLRSLRSVSNLMVVAHPDDETLWGGATLATEKGWGVLCLTNRSTRNRRLAFYKAMDTFGVEGVILDIPDRRSDPATSADIDQITAAVSRLLDQGKVKQVLTHGPDGEYGHAFHKLVCGTVSKSVGKFNEYNSKHIGLRYFNFNAEIDLRESLTGAWEIKSKALTAYFPEHGTPDSDLRHIELSKHEAPQLAEYYSRPVELLEKIYVDSSIEITP
jgi:LmbE family N-acetylglucosaminyl deacetylase